MKLLTQNQYMKQSGIFNWTLPAHNVQLNDGTRFNVCPNAGVCGAFCYAKTGMFMFPNVKQSHMEKLDLVLNHRSKWKQMMIDELRLKKYIGKTIRIHDAGDFFSIDYAMDWMEIMRFNPDVFFYAYTKQIHMFKIEITDHPENFVLIYLFGGKLDHMIDRENDRHSDVFTDYAKLVDANYFDVSKDDSLAAKNPNKKIGLYVNNIPHVFKKMKHKSFSQWSKKINEK